LYGKLFETSTDKINGLPLERGARGGDTGHKVRPIGGVGGGAVSEAEHLVGNRVQKILGFRI